MSKFKILGLALLVCGLYVVITYVNLNSDLQIVLELYKLVLSGPIFALLFGLIFIVFGLIALLKLEETIEDSFSKQLIRIFTLACIFCGLVLINTWQLIITYKDMKPLYDLSVEFYAVVSIILLGSGLNLLFVKEKKEN